MIIYTSIDLKTAQWKYFHTARSAGIEAAILLPCLIISATVQLSRVLDLTNPLVRKSLQISLADLRGSSWAGLTEETAAQRLGRLAYEAGFEALLVPSAGRGRNLNILRQNLLAGSTLEIINERDLPGK